VLSDLDARQVRQVHPVARPDHSVGEPRGLVVGHAAQDDGHQQRGGLVVGDFSPDDPFDEQVDRLARKRLSVTLPGDDIDELHEVGSIYAATSDPRLCGSRRKG
jgi:hypothetical protein